MFVVNKGRNFGFLRCTCGFAEMLRNPVRMLRKFKPAAIVHPTINLAHCIPGITKILPTSSIRMFSKFALINRSLFSPICARKKLIAGVKALSAHW